MKPFAAILAAILITGIASGRSYHYDDAGRLVLAIYENGIALRYTYTHGNNIDKVEKISVPAAPSAFTATRDYLSRSQLSWQDNSDAETGYLLQRRSLYSDDWEIVAVLGADATSHVDTTLLPSENYSYRVIATGLEEGLVSAYSMEAMASGVDSIAFHVTSIDLYDPDDSLFLLTFRSEAGKEYQLQSSGSLEANSWQPYAWQPSPSGAESAANIVGSGESTSIYLRDSTGQDHFFRLMLVE